jgi:hypothetical protein
MTDQKPMQGKKASDADAKDKAKIGPSTTKRPQAEVEGQGFQYRQAVCPNGDVVWLWYDTVNYRLYRCAVCGTVFYV